MSTAIPACPAKLPTGDWGARPVSPASIGDVVAITTRAGARWLARVVAVHGDIVATQRIDGEVPVADAPAPAGRAVHVERVGRRSYLRGDTYDARDTLKAAGCHWDAEQRAWWIGDHATAERLAAAARTAPATAAAPRDRFRQTSGGRYRYQGARRGRSCITGGNCSSVGSGRSCGGHDCDGY